MVGQISKRTGTAVPDEHAATRPSSRSRSRSRDEDADVELEDDGRAPLDFDEDDPLERRRDPLRR